MPPTAARRPGGLQVVCQVALSPVPSGGVCQVSGDPLKVPSEGPTHVLQGHVQTCVLFVCLGGMHGCDPHYPPPLTPPPIVPSAAQTRLSPSSCVISPSSACRAILPVVSVPRQFEGSRPRTLGCKVAFPRRPKLLSRPVKVLPRFPVVARHVTALQGYLITGFLASLVSAPNLLRVCELPPPPPGPLRRPRWWK